MQTSPGRTQTRCRAQNLSGEPLTPHAQGGLPLRPGSQPRHASASLPSAASNPGGRSPGDHYTRPASEGSWTDTEFLWGDSAPEGQGHPAQESAWMCCACHSRTLTRHLRSTVSSSSPVSGWEGGLQPPLSKPGSWAHAQGAPQLTLVLPVRGEAVRRSPARSQARAQRPAQGHGPHATAGHAVSILGFPARESWTQLLTAATRDSSDNGDRVALPQTSPNK